MKPFILKPDGSVVQQDESPHPGGDIRADDVHVPHLEPHVETFALDQTDEVKILIRYSCHCWSCGYEDRLHAGQLRFLDGSRARAFDPYRHDASIHLSGLMRNLPHNRIYVTRSERNYGAYCSTLMDAAGHRYTAFFTLRPRKGKFDGIRHKLLLVVESAYGRAQPEPGMKTNFRAVIAKAREGEMVKYRR